MTTMAQSWGGVEVIVDSALPMVPDAKMDIRRYVRHGLAEVLAWLGEDVGPRPGEGTHVFLMHDPAKGGTPVYLVSREFWERLGDRLDGQP